MRGGSRIVGFLFSHPANTPPTGAVAAFGRDMYTPGGPTKGGGALLLGRGARARRASGAEQWDSNSSSVIIKSYQITSGY